MKTVSIVVSNKVAAAINKLVRTGNLCTDKDGNNYTAFNIVNLSRPVHGARRVKVGDSGWWQMMPKSYSYGGRP